MCGRVRDPSIEEVSELKLNPLRSGWMREVLGGEWRPGSKVPAVISEDGARIRDDMRWGLVPSWSKSDRLDYSTYNARAERIEEAPTYKGAWHKSQRCLLPADGFYERHYYFTLRDRRLMTFAGLWDEWRSPITGEVVRTCTMITTQPNELVARVHNRMPVIIAERDRAKWLGEELTTEDGLRALLKPYPSDLMEVTPGLNPSPKPNATAQEQLRLF